VNRIQTAAKQRMQCSRKKFKVYQTEDDRIVVVRTE
jgi:hypothetical protein